MSEDKLLIALTSSKPVKKGKKSRIKKRLENNLMNQDIHFLNQK